MSNIDKKALRDIAESVEREEWEVLDNGDDEYQVIVKGSLEKGGTYRSYQPVANEISGQKISAFIATFNPVTMLALLDELEALQSFRTAFNEWHDKTEWVQGDNRFDVIKPWGKHRADVLKLYIEHLEAKLQTADKLQDSAFRHGLQHSFSLGQTDNQAGFEECLSAYGSRGKDNG
ncbi:ead/Ea22-like family protein [Citrobacter koseri]